MVIFEKVINAMTRTLHYIGSSCLAVMMFLTAADVLMRYFFNRPIFGAVEMTEFAMVFVVFLGVGYVALLDGHTSIDIFVLRASPRAQAAIASLVNFICFCFLVLMLWGALMEAKAALSNNIRSMLLLLPIFPFVLLMAFGIAIFVLVSFLHICKNIRLFVRK